MCGWVGGDVPLVTLNCHFTVFFIQWFAMITVEVKIISSLYEIKQPYLFCLFFKLLPKE